MTPRSALGMSAVAVAAALALSAWFRSGEDVGAATNVHTDSQPALRHPLPGSLPLPVAAVVPAGPASAPAAPVFLVPLTLVAPQRLLVGEADDLVISIGAGANEVSFTVVFDPDVLQVRTGSEGPWAVGAHARFTAEIPEAADRVQIASAVSGQHAGLAAGTIATVSFHAVGTGTTSVRVSDVLIKDSAGRSLRSAVWPSNLQVTVDAQPPPQPGRLHRTVAAEASPEGD